MSLPAEVNICSVTKRTTADCYEAKLTCNAKGSFAPGMSQSGHRPCQHFDHPSGVARGPSPTDPLGREPQDILGSAETDSQERSSCGCQTDRSTPCQFGRTESRRSSLEATSLEATSTGTNACSALLQDPKPARLAATCWMCISSSNVGCARQFSLA